MQPKTGARPCASIAQFVAIALAVSVCTLLPSSGVRAHHGDGCTVVDLSSRFDSFEQLIAHVHAVVSVAPYRMHFVVPRRDATVDEPDAFATAVVHVLTADTNSSSRSGDADRPGAVACGVEQYGNYRVVQLLDRATGSLVRGVMEWDATPSVNRHVPATGWGSYFANTPDNAHRNVAVSAPHILYDKGTAKEAAQLFTATRARFALFSGAHRCASPQEVEDVTYKTTVCSGDTHEHRPFRVSDAAHSPLHPMHAIHLRLRARVDALDDDASSRFHATPWRMTFLQLHAHGKPLDVCPDFVLSHTHPHTPSLDSPPLRAFHAALLQSTVPPPLIARPCTGRVADHPGARCKLCGTSNVSYRVLRTDATVGAARLVHVEQSRRARRRRHGFPARVIGAVCRAWPYVDVDGRDDDADCDRLTNTTVATAPAPRP